MSILGFPKDFVVNKIKQNVAHVLLTNGNVYQVVVKALGCFHKNYRFKLKQITYMNFIYLVMYMVYMYIVNP
jgi:hypothetical protein